MRVLAAGVVGAVTAAATLAGCGGDDSGDGETTLGGPDSDCPLPVTFRMPDGWSAEGFDEKGSAAFAKEYGKEYGLPGRFRVACELEPDTEPG